MPLVFLGRALGIGILALSLGACAPSEVARSGGGHNTLTPAQEAAGWTLLFDGEDLSDWRGFQRSDSPAGWRVHEGAIYFDPSIGGGDIVTRETYGDFELELEWMIAECGNSGIFYRGAEGGYSNIWETAPEYQVLDDACHPDARYPSHRAGANYDLHTPTEDVVQPAGEWNTVRIVAHGPRVEHWLNGIKVVEYEQDSEDWEARVAVSKFREMPSYGQHMSGHIALQDHGDEVWYRNIRIRRING